MVHSGMRQTALVIDAEVRLYAEVLLVAFLRLSRVYEKPAAAQLDQLVLEYRDSG